MAKRYCILSYKVLILAIICCFINANAQAAPILKLNSHGHDVIVLQQNLIRMNYDLSKVSGNYDKETQEAVKAFQKDHKIKVTLPNHLALYVSCLINSDQLTSAIFLANL